MGSQVIKQPDGLYAIFSNNTDSWIVYDATREEVVHYFVEKIASAERERAVKILDAVDSDDAKAIYHQFVMTFEEANEEHNERHEPIKFGEDDPNG